MIELLGFNAQLLIALDLEQTFWRTFLANAPLFPGVLEVLNLLRSYSIPIGVVTDLTSHIQLRKLTFFGLEDTFDAVVTSEETGADKPNYKNFQLILKKLNLKNLFRASPYVKYLLSQQCCDSENESWNMRVKNTVAIV